MAIRDLSAQRLREVLDYDPETGVFRWRVKRGRCSAGSIAGCTDTNGYVMIRVDGVIWLAHRLAWLHVHGEFPRQQIDHINGNRGDNSIRNIRDVSPTHNQQNLRGPRGATKSGLLGVKWDKYQWVAVITVSGKRRFLGRFDDPANAHEAYVRAKRLVHSGCTI